MEFRPEEKKAPRTTPHPFVPADAGTQASPQSIAAKELDARFRGHERSVTQRNRITAIAHTMLDRAGDILDAMEIGDARRRALVSLLLCPARACQRAKACRKKACRHAPCTALSTWRK